MVFPPLRGEQTNSPSSAAVPLVNIKSCTAARDIRTRRRPSWHWGGVSRRAPCRAWLLRRSSLGVRQFHRDMWRAANHARTAVGIGAAFEHFQQKEEFLGEHVRILRWA